MIIIKTAEEIRKIEKSCRIVAEVLEELKSFVRAGITTKEIEVFAENKIYKKGGTPAFKGYRGYPSSICTSVNNQVVHGIPSELRLKEGDILSLDLGVLIDGFYGDSAITLPVGKISPLANRLLKITEDALYIGIDMATPNNRVSDISTVIQKHVESNGFSVVKTFVGHGIGIALHEDPQIPNFGMAGQGPRLRSGMTLAIEPMVNSGRDEVKILDDGWTAVTADNSLSAHFEHTIAISDDGEPKILTKL
ncbi:MAG: type I methionyl aminopeptidase [Nitrospiraceae bacterium]|nr:type I methionyl aminopeptidase [Nitrospiraceae bacterium]